MIGSEIAKKMSKEVSTKIILGPFEIIPNDNHKYLFYTTSDGLLEGSFKHLIYNKVHKLEEYHNGKRNGLSMTLYGDGTLKIMETFVNDKRHGFSRMYYESGHLASSYPYNNGNRDGICEDFFEDGKIQHRRSFKDDKLHGECMVTDQYCKSIVQTTIYNNGKLVK